MTGTARREEGAPVAATFADPRLIVLGENKMVGHAIHPDTNRGGPHLTHAKTAHDLSQPAPVGRRVRRADQETQKRCQRCARPGSSGGGQRFDVRSRRLGIGLRLIVHFELGRVWPKPLEMSLFHMLGLRDSCHRLPLSKEGGPRCGGPPSRPSVGGQEAGIRRAAPWISDTTSVEREEYRPLYRRCCGRRQRRENGAAETYKLPQMGC